MNRFTDTVAGQRTRWSHAACSNFSVQNPSMATTRIELLVRVPAHAVDVAPTLNTRCRNPPAARRR
eukprot:8460898-Heterocapsa_arctica.AAC.1